MELVPTMDDNALPLELSLAIDKAEKKNQRAIRSAGYGASDLGMHITKTYVEKLAAHIKENLKGSHLNAGYKDGLRIIGQLSDETIALCALQTALHSVATYSPSTEMFLSAGRALASECWAAGLTRHDQKLAERIERVCRVKHGSVKYRQQAARSIAKRAGYTVKRWSPDRLVHIGSWLVDRVVECLPDVFDWVQDGDGTYVLTLTAEGLAKAEDAVSEAILRKPVYVPRADKPLPWTDWYMKHPDPRVAYEASFLRTIHKDLRAACTAAVKDGTMKPALDAVTTLQSVPWRINKRVYGVLRGCMERNIEVPGLPTVIEQQKPPVVRPWDQMTESERVAWRIEASEVENLNRASRSERLLLVEDMQIAEMLLDEERFYTAMNCDWRGRVYALPHFNFQREDRVRALFEFSEGQPIGDGLQWLQMHVANCGAFDKIDKAPLQERIQWTINNTTRIREMCEIPLKDLWWTKADNPFLFLAAAMELVSCLSVGASAITHLPVSFDGSCSGLQHLASMTRDAETASLVNLTPGERPSDVYAVIADDVKARVEEDEDPLAAKFLAYGIDRKLAKRNVMTYSYSSKKFGMASQQQTDLMDVLQRDVLRRKIEEHPFDPSHKGSVEKPGRAARFIASHIYDAIEARIHLPAQAMKFLQSLAKTMAHEGKPLRWTSPAGIPWINRYHPPLLTRLRLWLHDKGVVTNIKSLVAVGNEKEIDKDKAANGVAPNFVHALDASHLMLTVNAASQQGITNIATVHDSFGCLASQATEFNKIIRTELVRMYETHDVLSEVLEQAKCDLTQHNWDRLPVVPERGPLNLKEIENAQYAFA